MTTMANEQSNASRDLIWLYEGLATPMYALVAREDSVIDDLRDAYHAGDPEALDAVLRVVIKRAQAARKILKKGPPATETPNGITISDVIEVPHGVAADGGVERWIRAAVTGLSYDGSEVRFKHGTCVGWEPADRVRKI